MIYGESLRKSDKGQLMKSSFLMSIARTVFGESTVSSEVSGAMSFFLRGLTIISFGLVYTP